MGRTRRPGLAAAALGAGLGLLSAVGVLTATSGAGVSGVALQPPRIEVTHLPPLLTAPGESVTLRYDIYCVGSSDPTAICAAGGTVYARAGDAGPFRALPLRLDAAAAEGRYAVRVPDSLVRSGFSYYALMHDDGSGATATVPQGGADAPERSEPLGAAALSVRLGRHAFGALRTADARVASAPWGDGAGDAGLEEQSPDATPIGASSFDIDSSGSITVLDEAHKRLLRWTAGSSIPEAVAVAVRGTIADVASGPEGSTYVLEAAAGGSPARLRTFDRDGTERAAVDAGPEVEAVGAGSNGPVVLEPRSGRWLAPGRAAPPSVGRLVGSGLRLVVYRPNPGELRVALVDTAGEVARSWRIQSSTPVAEVQLAEPLAGKLVLVLRVYEERQAEFVALVLGPTGVEQQFSVDASDWAETAPLGHFRLAGSSLYRLGSTPAGIFVDRYDLGVS